MPASVGGSPAEVGAGCGSPRGQGHWQQKLWEVLLVLLLFIYKAYLDLPTHILFFSQCCFFHPLLPTGFNFLLSEEHPLVVLSMKAYK